MLAYKKKTMTQLWALAIVAMFVCCAFSVCAASDWSMAEEEESESGPIGGPEFDPEILGYLGKILSEEQLDALIAAIEMMNEYFPVDLDGELLPMLNFMLDMKINVGEDYDDNGADIRHLDKDHNELTGDETVIVLEDGAKLEFSKDLAVDTIIIAGKDVTIAGTEGAKLIFKTLKFPCLTLFGDDDDAETAKPYEMSFDNGSKLLLSYSAVNGLFEIVEGEPVPAEQKKVSLDLSLGVAGTSVTIHQVDYELKDEHYDNYAYNDTVFTSNSGNNIAFSFDADLTAIYGDLLVILDGSGPVEVPIKALAVITEGDFHMPDIELSLSSDAVETVNSYSDHYTLKDGEVIKEESTYTDKDVTKVDGVSLSFTTVSATNELNFAFNVGSVLQTEDKSNHNSQIDEATKEKTENGYTRGEKTELNGLLAKVAVKNGSASAEIGLNSFTHSESRVDETNSSVEETYVKDLKLVADLKYEGLKALVSAVVGGLYGSDGEGSETGLADIIKNLDVSGVNLGASFQFDLGELRVTDGDTHSFENVEGDMTETLSNVLIKDLHLGTSILKGKATAEIRLGVLDVVDGRETPTTLYGNNVRIEQFFVTLDINTENFLAFVIEALSGMNGVDDEEDEEEESSETVPSFPEYLFGLDMSELYAGDSIAIDLGVFNLSTKDLSKDEFPAA
ncbi:MAG: hypothetical protein MJZ21_02715, partial [archaeon]|nr:hypothetical protein [archaeon]